MDQHRRVAFYTRRYFADDCDSLMECFANVRMTASKFQYLVDQS